MESWVGENGHDVFEKNAGGGPVGEFADGGDELVFEVGEFGCVAVGVEAVGGGAGVIALAEGWLSNR